jgi:uncharacterized membrane protein YfcA
VRAIGVFVGVFAAVVAVLFAAVGQLGKIDRQTLVVVLVLSAVAAAIGAWRTIRRL